MKPLSGIRVLDLSRVVSGPFCTMLLGDLGAEIIKIEDPNSGDESRHFGPPFVGGESAYFLSVNRNKRSCTLNLKSPEGIRILGEIARHCDVLIENFRPGTLARLGLGEHWLRSTNDRLIRCSISGFGTSGPDAERPGYDLIVQGEAGIMDITGSLDGPPMKVGTSIADLVTGLYAAQGVLAALLERQTTGKARSVEIAMLDSLASLLTFNAGMFFTTGHSPTRRGNAHPTIYPYETFQAADGWVNVGIANDKFWQLFCKAIDDKGLAEDPRFRTAPLRVQNRAELQPILGDILHRQPRSHWIELLGSAGIPCGAIRTVGEVCSAEQLVSRGQIVDLLHPTAGSVKNILSPVRLDDEPLADHTAPPLFGEHTNEILTTLGGVHARELEALRSAGVIAAQPVST